MPIIKYKDGKGYNHTCVITQDNLLNTIKQAKKEGATEVLDGETGELLLYNNFIK